MSISFDNIPNDVKTPFAFIEFNNSRAAGGGSQSYKVAVIGQKLATGTHPKEVKIRVTSAAEAAKLFGEGSMLHSMIEKFKLNNTSTELWAIALDDNGAGTQSAKTLTVTATAAKAGVLQGYVGGVLIQVGVTAGMSATDIATALAVKITATKLCPFEAAAAIGVVTITAKHKGEIFEELEISFNHNFGESYPEGVSVAIASSVAGAGNPDVQAAINVFGDEQFNVVLSPYTDTANLIAIETEMDLRFGPAKQIEGMIVAAANQSHGSLGTLGDSRNSQHLTIMSCYKSPTPSYEVAAVYAAVLAFYGAIDPGRPFQTLDMKGVLAPKDEFVFIREERNLLILDGIATFFIVPGGKVKVEYAVTTYNLGALGNQDYSYQNVNTLLTLSYLRFSLRNMLLGKYPRHKLSINSDGIGNGQAVVTPKIIKGEMVALFSDWREMALVEDAKQFAAELIVEINATNPDRVDFLASPNLINQMRVFAGQIQFLS